MSNNSPPSCEQPACVPKVELFLGVIRAEGSSTARGTERYGSHGKDGMESVALTRCSKPGCDALASPKVKNTRGGSFCARHAKYSCTDEGCTTETFCLLHAQAQHGQVSARSCLQPGCSNQPVLHQHGGERAVLCAQHTEDRSAKASVRQCPKRGCRKHRNFGTLTVKLAEFCRQHAKEGMVDLRVKRCSQAGCAAPAACGVRGTRNPEFCSIHAKDGLVKILRFKPCAETGCIVRASYALEGTRRGEFCAPHAKAGMVNVRSQRCVYQGCTKQPRFGVNGTRTREFCGLHAPEGMAAIYPRWCGQEGCRRKRLPAVIGQKMGRFCAQHAPDGMVDVTTIPTAATISTNTTATNTTTSGRSNCKKVGGSTRALDGIGDVGEPERSVEEVTGEGPAMDRGDGAECAKRAARKQKFPRVSTGLEQDAAGKEPFMGLRTGRRKLLNEQHHAGAAPT